MERLTGKGAKSLKEAYAKVYSEQATPDYASMSDEEFAALVKKSGNPEGLMAKRKQQQIAARENSRANYTADDARADQEKAKVEAENKRRAEKGEDPLPTSQPAQASQPTAKPPTDQEKVRAEYDRLRNSTDPKERAQAVTYGRQMAAAGASKSNFSGYQSAADAKKNLPAPAQRTSIADRLKAIRDMRSSSQSRITAQGGKPATPAVQPKTQPAAAQPKTQPAAATPVTSQSAASRALNTGSLKDKQDAMDTVNNNYASSLSTQATDMMIKNIKNPKPAVTPNQQSSLNNTVRSGTGGSPSGSDRAAEIRARAAAARERAMQNASPSARRTIQDLQNRRNASRNRAQGNLGRPMIVTTGSGSNATTRTYAAGTSKSDPNLAAEIKNARNLIKPGSGTPTGNTVQTKMNPDSSLRVTQRRTPAATARIKQSLDIQSADLFDIIQGEFIEEGYTQEDTVYMMANLNEEQLQEFMKYVQGAINVGKRIPGIRGAINRVGAMFNRAPKQMPSGQVGALRLYQDKAKQSVDRLNRSTAASRIKDATTKPTTRNLDPRAVSDRNAREAAAQVRARNTQLGRPVDAAPQPVDKLNYKPGDPMFDDYVKRHHANQRGGVVKFTDGARRIDK